MKDKIWEDPADLFDKSFFTVLSGVSNDIERLHHTDTGTRSTKKFIRSWADGTTDPRAIMSACEFSKSLGFPVRKKMVGALRSMSSIWRVKSAMMVTIADLYDDISFKFYDGIPVFASANTPFFMVAILPNGYDVAFNFGGMMTSLETNAKYVFFDVAYVIRDDWEYGLRNSEVIMYRTTGRKNYQMYQHNLPLNIEISGRTGSHIMHVAARKY
jgi:hypothetical protein